MKLSDAIRLGAMLKPQGFNSRDPDVSCALRAAGDALGFRTPLLMSAPYIELERTYSWLWNAQSCPHCGERVLGTSAIYHLNDIHRWTREQIADWVATVEPHVEPLETQAVTV